MKFSDSSSDGGVTTSYWNPTGSLLLVIITELGAVREELDGSPAEKNGHLEGH
jgi:hypothetical protein